LRRQVRSQLAGQLVDDGNDAVGHESVSLRQC
jgi:hypothetical protein